MLIRAADDSGRVLRALAVEAVRVGDRTPEQAVTDTDRAVLLGSRVIPIDQSALILKSPYANGNFVAKPIEVG